MSRSAAAMESRIGGKLATVGHHRRFDQQAGEQIGFRLYFKEPAQGIDRIASAWSVVGLALRHQIEIRIVDGGRDRFEEIFMGFAHGKRQSSPLRGNRNALRDRLIERLQPLAHGALRHGDFVALAGIECTQRFRSWSVKHLGLRRRSGSRLAPVGCLLGPRSGAGPRRSGYWFLGEPERLDGRRHAAEYDVAQRRADIGGCKKRKQRADDGHGRGEAEGQDNRATESCAARGTCRSRPRISAWRNRNIPGRTATSLPRVREEWFGHCPAAILIRRMTGLNVPSACRIVKNTRSEPWLWVGPYFSVDAAEIEWCPINGVEQLLPRRFAIHALERFNDQPSDQIAFQRDEARLGLCVVRGQAPFDRLP